MSTTLFPVFFIIIGKEIDHFNKYLIKTSVILVLINSIYILQTPLE